MKGVILAGGRGKRLGNLTEGIGKHLVPLKGKAMVFYPLEYFKKLKINDVLLIVSPSQLENTKNVLGNGEKIGLNLSYAIQDEPKGMGHALALAEEFASGGNIAVSVCDNIFEDDLDISDFEKGARVYLKETPRANKYLVAEVMDGRVTDIEEKPENPKSNYAVTGFYLYDNKIFDFIRGTEKSVRGEIELAKSKNNYIGLGEMDFRILEGFWVDTGLPESLKEAEEFLNSIDN
tara:strand:- start:7929 stop:8630 length:702 start_codon:yes stop_codon:yes gene_type:complete